MFFYCNRFGATYLECNEHGHAYFIFITGMQHHLSQLEDIISVSRSAMCDLGFLFGRWVPNSSTVSNSNQFSFLSRIGKVSSLRPNFTSVLEHSSREVQCGEGTIEMKPGQNADNPLLPKCVIMKKQPFYDHKKDIIRSWYLGNFPLYFRPYLIVDCLVLMITLYESERSFFIFQGSRIELWAV